MFDYKVEVITPLIAAEYLKFNTCNRKPNRCQVAYYAKMMGGGKWELNGEAIKFAPNGRLLDGQHRLMACVEANVPFTTLVLRGVEEKVFDTFDQGWQRKKGQIFSLANIPNSTNVAAAINKYLVMGVARVTSLEAAGVRRGSARQVMSPRECLDEYSRNPEYWQELQKACASMYSRCRLMAQSEIASITAHLNLRCGHELSFVMEFFTQLFYEETTEVDVIRKLRNKLIRDAMSTTKMQSQHRTQLIRKAWDCYKTGTNPQVLKWVKGVEEEKPFE